MSIRSSHLNTSGLSSISALKTASSFLVERLCDGRVTAFVERPRDGCHPEPVLAGRVLIVCYELNEAGLIRLKGLTGGSDNLEIGS